MLKNKETVAKEFMEKFEGIYYGKFDDTPNYPPEGFKEDVLSFLSSQRVADLEAVMGMVEETKSEVDAIKNNLSPYSSGYIRALSDLLAKLEEVKGKINE